MTRDQVPLLRLKWAFGFLGRPAAVAQPTIVGGLVFVGGGDREVYALDAKSGCTRWTFKTEAVVRTAISFAPISGTDQFAVFFGDLRANAYAVNAITGALVWKTKVEDHPAALITGAPILYSGILYVPVSSMEEVTGSPSAYQCCTFRGSVVALDIATGKQIWKSYTIPEAPRPTKQNAVGTQLYGPSGAAVWSPFSARARPAAVKSTSTRRLSQFRERISLLPSEGASSRPLSVALPGQFFLPPCPLDTARATRAGERSLVSSD